jgi:hypothetical protein
VRSADSGQKGVADDDDRRVAHSARGGMTLTEHALQGAVLETGSTNRLCVGLPWFRSMPFSAILGLELSVAGEPVADVRLERAATAGAYWFLQDRQALRWPGSPVPGERAEVVLRMRLQLPNLTRPDGGAVEVLQEVRGEVPVVAAS